MPPTEPDKPHCPHDGRIVALEQRVDEHGRRLTTVEATVQQNEAVNQQSRIELTSTVRALSDNFTKMEFEQKDMPALVKDMHSAIIGTITEDGIATKVRQWETAEGKRSRVKDLILGGVITLIAGVVASLIYYAIAGHPIH